MVRVPIRIQWEFSGESLGKSTWYFLLFVIKGAYLPGNGFVLLHFPGGGQPLPQANVERPIFRNFEIPNIKRTKDFFNFEFIFYFYICLNYLNSKNI